jgi:hypothetical protein
MKIDPATLNLLVQDIVWLLLAGGLFLITKDLPELVEKLSAALDAHMTAADKQTLLADLKLAAAYAHKTGLDAKARDQVVNVVELAKEFLQALLERDGIPIDLDALDKMVIGELHQSFPEIEAELLTTLQPAAQAPAPAQKAA